DRSKRRSGQWTRRQSFPSRYRPPLAFLAGYAPMKELSASAGDVAPAPIERCFELLADIEHYPDWYPAGVKSVDVLERDPDDRPSLVAAKLSLGDGPIRKDFNLRLAVATTAPSTSGVELTRVKRDAADAQEMVVAWALAPDGDDKTQLTVKLDAK